MTGQKKALNFIHYTQWHNEKQVFAVSFFIIARKNQAGADLSIHLNFNITGTDYVQNFKKILSIEPYNMFVSIVTDTSEAEPLARSLRENLDSPMSYSKLVKSGLPQELLAEDDEVAKYKLNVRSVKIIPSADTFQ